ncbi:hypothetical protein DEU56DRAFT_812518 [Suillus clintonianus]|uniref:uncharacterized protein n=1 Tax=Suillus clintonianus TaxID=1904413 RepID=UPI001B869235|nr:uncharacterized protein DEU56DRAFT_812518 [Suillus clintonianus]KAG2132380.1 hypothetical protein DEU56DRAFT_812518 [Suillus clintonianus]
MEFPTMNNFWDLSQTPSQFSQLGDDDFLALLQKQYPNTVPDINSTDIDDVNQKPPLPGLTPPSDDSSPSPPSINSANHSRSRHQSTFSRGNDNEESALKRKASDDDMEEGPSTKNQHTADDPSNSKKGPMSRRKSGGSQDDTRLLKRKEQNRAAQRAFRERKEKHVKDLEDKVAALEAKNKDAQNENSNLRDLLARLQEENLALKQAQFTFSMPKAIDHPIPQASSSASPQTVQAPFSFFSSPPAVPPPAPPALRSSPKPFSDIDWSSLTTFDPSLLSAMDEIPSGPMQIDPSTSPYGQYALPAPNQYKTLATNTFFMSFADSDSNSFNNGPPSNENVNNNTSNGLNQFPFNFPSPSNSWNSTRNGQSTAEFSQSAGHSDYMQNHSLDELFGETFMNGQSVDFGALLKSPPPPTISPVTHANGNAQSPPSSISSKNSMASPLSAHPLSSPSSASTSNGQSPFSWTMSRQDAESPPSASEPASNVNPGGAMARCPTRDDIEKYIVASGDSPFTSSPFTQPAVRKMSDASQGGNMISCEGSQFPKTKESSENIEVLKAWRTITSHPQFKDADINHLCTEFTKKARCDGTKVVLEPEGVHHILETFKAKSLAQNQQQQQQQTSTSSSN